MDNANTNWLSGIYGSLFRESKEKQQRQKILLVLLISYLLKNVFINYTYFCHVRYRKSSKLRMPYCRPDHVFIMYASEIFLKQIEMILEKTTQTISSLNCKFLDLKNIMPFIIIAFFTRSGIIISIQLNSSFRTYSSDWVHN